jgi:DNA polymerase gamma 1
MLTIHDEIRTMVRDEDITKAVYALQLAHLYARSAFIKAHKLNDIPSGVAWFSAVDVDSTCLRKNPYDPQITPTQAALPLGYTVNPKQLLELLDGRIADSLQTV